MLPEPHDPTRPIPCFGENPSPASAFGTDPAAENAEDSSKASSSSSGASVLAEVSPGVWGTIVNFERVGKKEDEEQEVIGAEGKKKKKAKGQRSRASNFIVDVLVNTAAAGEGRF